MPKFKKPRFLLNVGAFYPATCYGGPIFSTLNLSKSLVGQGIDLKVVTTNINCLGNLNVETNKFINVDGVSVKYYGLTISKRYAFSIIQLLFFWRDVLKSDIQYINSIFSCGVPLGLILSKLFSKRTIITPRGGLGIWAIKNGNKLKNLWLSIFIKPFSNWVMWHATSEQEKNEILSHFPNANVKIIPNGIYVSEFKKINFLKKEIYLKKYINRLDRDVNKIIVSMGRLQKKKGFDILIDSFERILEVYPNSYLLIAGPDEGERKKLESQIETLKLSNAVFLIGNIDDQCKLDFLGNADLFVLPSHNENFGNVYLESLASGTPILASKNTPWEMVSEYDCGLWVENTVEKTANSAIELLERNRELMRKNSIKLASQYDWCNIARQFIDEFRLY